MDGKAHVAVGTSFAACSIRSAFQQAFNWRFRANTATQNWDSTQSVEPGGNTAQSSKRFAHNFPSLAHNLPGIENLPSQGPSAMIHALKPLNPNLPKTQHGIAVESPAVAHCQRTWERVYRSVLVKRDSKALAFYEAGEAF